MTRPTITHDDEKVENEHAVNRRQLILGGTVLGAAALSGTGVAGATEEVTDEVTDALGRPEEQPADAMGLPPLVPGAEILAVSPLHGGTFYTTSSVMWSSNGYYVPGANTNISKLLPLPAGSRIVRLHPRAWAGGWRSQTWWLYQVEPTANSGTGYTTRWSKTYSYSGYLTANESVNILILPGYQYEMWTAVFSSAPVTYDRGITVQYEGPVGPFFPIAPKRVYDSRVSGGRIYNGQERLVFVGNQLGGGTVVPSGAKAVALNVTLDATRSSGYLSVRPDGTAYDGTSSINWFMTNEIIANGVTSKLGGDRRVRVRTGGVSGGSTHFIFDVVGYYL